MLIRNNFLAMNQNQEKTSLVKPVQQSNTNQHIAQPANSAGSAAVYNHRRADDYDMTKLNALENKITNRQEEINHQVNYPRALEIRLQGQALELKEQEVYQMQDRLVLKEKMQEDLLKKANPVSDSSSNHEESLRIANQQLETDEKDEKTQDNVADEF